MGSSQSGDLARAAGGSEGRRRLSRIARAGSSTRMSAINFRRPPHGHASASTSCSRFRTKRCSVAPRRGRLVLRRARTTRPTSWTSPRTSWPPWIGTSVRATAGRSSSSRSPAPFHVTSTATSGRSGWCRKSSALLSHHKVGRHSVASQARHQRRVGQGGAGPARPQVRAAHAPVHAPGVRRGTSVDGRAEAGKGTARPGGACSCQPGVNGLSNPVTRCRTTKVKRP